MQIVPYISHQPLPKGSFLERNPPLCYLLVCGAQKKHGIMIDSGCSLREIVKDLERYKASLDFILLTHNHGDHTLFASELLRLLSRYTA